ncbi:MAG: RNA polymerase sigma factor [Lentisphaeria bacterium]
MESISQELLGRCKRGDEAAWREFHGRLHLLLRLAVFRQAAGITEHEVDDIVQDALLELTRKFRELDNPAGYALRITVNKAVDWVRGRKLANNTVSLSEPANPGGDGTAAETLAAGLPDDKRWDEGLMAAEGLACLHQVLAGFQGHECHGLIHGRYYDGLSYRELAARCRLADDQVGPRLARCVDRLRRLLKTNPEQLSAVLAIKEYGVCQAEAQP